MDYCLLFPLLGFFWSRQSGQTRLRNARRGDNVEGPPVKNVEIKTQLPSGYTLRYLGFVTYVFDVTGQKPVPVRGSMEEFRDPDTFAYRMFRPAGLMWPDQFMNIDSWTEVGMVAPDLLVPPYSGSRQYKVELRLIDIMDKLRELGAMTGAPFDLASIMVLEGSGILDEIVKSALEYNHVLPGSYDEQRVLWSDRVYFSHTFRGKGYKEADEHWKRASELAIHLAMAVAMADGEVDEGEREVIKDTVEEWLSKGTTPPHSTTKEEQRTSFARAMEEGYARAVRGGNSKYISELADELNQISDKATCYEVLQLCFDVMAADKVAHTQEMRIIHTVSDALHLDYEEVAKIRDLKIVGLDTAAPAQQASVEELLGIKGSWDKARIKRHLRGEFQKWNNRLNVLEEGPARENAQQMLDRIADLHKKYR